MQTMRTDSMDKLIRQLSVSAKVIDSLIEIVPPKSARSATVERKLTELQDRIAEIPSSFADLTERWDAEISALWVKFALNFVDKEGDECVRSSRLLSPFQSVASSMTQQFDHSNHSNHNSSRNLDHLATPSSSLSWSIFDDHAGMSGADCQIANDNEISKLPQIANCKINYTKQECLNRIAEAFAKLDPCRDRNDLPQLKRLLALAIKCRALCQPFCPDQLPFCEVYDCTWARLSADLQQMFIDEIRMPKTISRFIAFLMRYLRIIGKKRATEIGYGNTYCSYCRINGHTSDDCIVLRDYTMCYICTEIGHSYQRCPTKGQKMENILNDMICSL